MRLGSLAGVVPGIVNTFTANWYWSLLAFAAVVFFWAAWRVDLSYRNGAELAQIKTALARAESAHRDFVAQSDKAVAALVRKIEDQRAAAIAAEAALDAARQRFAAEFETLKGKVAVNVPARPQCDYPQHVLNGLRDAHARAAR